MKDKPHRQFLTEEELMPTTNLAERFQAIAKGEDAGYIVLSANEYRNLVISHNKLYEYIFCSNPDLLVTKRMQAAGEIYDQTKMMR